MLHQLRWRPRRRLRRLGADDVLPLFSIAFAVALIATPLLVPVIESFTRPTHDVFVRVSDMGDARWDPAAVRLLDGRVLVVGGAGNSTHPREAGDWPALASAELFDPATATFRSTGSMSTPRQGSIAALLPDGRVLVAGGAPDRNGSPPLSSAELYDPTTGMFSPTGSMTQARLWALSATLDDGRILVVGSEDANGEHIDNSADIYDPVTGSFRPTGRSIGAWEFSTATTLLDGRVLLAGGRAPNGVDEVAVAELYDPKTGMFSVTQPLLEERDSPAVRLTDGKVLFAGGCDRTSAELFDPATSSFSRTGAMLDGTCGAQTALLPNGSVLVLGLDDTELYDPADGSFRRSNGRAWVDGAAVVPLADGRVLIAGGQGEDDYAPAQQDAWLYLP